MGRPGNQGAALTAINRRPSPGANVRPLYSPMETPLSLTAKVRVLFQILCPVCLCVDDESLVKGPTASELLLVLIEAQRVRWFC